MWFEGDWMLLVLTGAILSQFVSFYLRTSVKHNERHNLHFLKNSFSKYIFATICLLISGVVVPILAIVVILCTLYRGLIYITLKAKYKEKFKGFVAGRDVIWLVEKPQFRNVILALLLVEEVEGVSKSVYEIAKEAIMKEVKFGSLKGTKVVYSFHKTLGYFYNLDEESLSDHYFLEFDTANPTNQYISHDEIGKKLSMCYNNPLPHNHTRYFELLVSKKPILWKQFDSKKSYPIILRIHHSIGDGISIFNLIKGCINFGPLTVVDTKIIKDDCTDQKDQYYNKKTGVKSFLNVDVDGISAKIVEYGKMIMSFLIFVIFFPNCVIVQNLLRPKDVNPLHGPKLSGQKKFYWHSEDREELVPIIKRMRRRVDGSYFEDFLITAFSASFHEYFEKVQQKIKKLPEFITGVVPAKLDFKRSQQGRTKKFTFTNNFSVGLFNLPIEIHKNDNNKTKATSLIPRFRETVRQTNLLRNSIDFHINYWGMTIFNAVIPALFLHYFYQLSKFTSFLSVLPGPDAFSFFNTLPVNEMMYWLPNRGYVGVGLTCLTFNKRFHFGLIVDKALLSKDDNLQEILDNIPKYLKILEQEINGPVMT